MAISSYSAAKTTSFIIFTLIFPLVLVLGDIRNHTIISKNQGELFLDSFSFIETTGYFNVKLINISFFPNHYSNSSYYNLSDIGFFLSPHKKNHLLNGSKDVLFPYPHTRITTSCFLHQPFEGGDRDRDRDSSHLLVYTLDKLRDSGKRSAIFINKTGDYVLYFQNCVHNLSVNINVQSQMYNLHNASRPLYLSPTKTIVIKMNFFFSLIHFLFACLWGYYILHLNNNKLATVTWIHVLMPFVPFFKAWSLLSQALHYYYILHIGCAQCYPSLLLTFAFNYLAETPLLLWLVLFFTGWSLLKPTQLLHQDKRLLIRVVYFQILLNLDIFLTDPITGNEIYHTEPGVFFGYSIFFKMYLLHKGIRSSKEFLKELGSGTYAKASVSVRYINLFRSLYFKYVIYHAYYRLVDYNNIWMPPPFLSTLLKEFIVLVFYVHIAHKVRPELHNSKLLMIDDDAKKGGQ